MNTETVAIKSIKPDPHNAKLHPEKNFAAITASLKRFGQQKPIVVDGDGIIVAGNGTYLAAVAMKWKTIAIVRTELKGQDARDYALADNRIGDLGEWDFKKLIDQLDGASVRGFDESDVAEMRARMDNLETMEAGGGDGEKNVGMMKLKDQGSAFLVFRLDSIGIVEKAIAATGKANRAEAIDIIFRSYLDGQGQLNIL